MSRVLQAISLFILGGCVVYSNEPPPNYAPAFLYADAGCYWDDYYWDYVWYFDADVDDDLGPQDVVYVWADVYDTRSGYLEDSFELVPEAGVTWYSAWLGSSTWLNSTWPYYEVVLSAEDGDGAVSSVSLTPAPCW